MSQPSLKGFLNMSKKELPAEDAGIDTAELGINTAIESIAGVPIPKPS